MIDLFNHVDVFVYYIGCYSGANYMIIIIWFSVGWRPHPCGVGGGGGAGGGSTSSNDNSSTT